MPKQKLTCAVLLSGILYSSGALAADTRGVEPAQDAVLTIDGKKHQLVVGSSNRLKIQDKVSNVHLEISPYKKFQKAGIGFQYLGQRHFSYEKLSERVDHWSLDGNNTIIMVQHYSVPVTEKAIMDQFQRQFLSMKAELKTSPAKIRFKGGKLKGNRLDIRLGNIRLSQEIFVIPGKKETRTFILQDTITSSGKNTNEYEQTRKRIEKSLSI